MKKRKKMAIPNSQSGKTVNILGRIVHFSRKNNHSIAYRQSAFDKEDYVKTKKRRIRQAPYMKLMSKSKPKVNMISSHMLLHFIKIYLQERMVRKAP